MRSITPAEIRALRRASLIFDLWVLGIVLSALCFVSRAWGQTVPDFHLRPDSPAIDAGICLPEVKTDFDGNPRPQGKGCDIGAYEFVPQTNLPPTPPRNLRVISDDGEIVAPRPIVEFEPRATKIGH